MATMRLILNDGTVYEGSSCGYWEGNLWCYILGKTMAEAFSDFYDKEKTKRINFQTGEVYMNDHIYEGFTHLSTMIERESQIEILLNREPG